MKKFFSFYLKYNHLIISRNANEQRPGFLWNSDRFAKFNVFQIIWLIIIINTMIIYLGAAENKNQNMQEENMSVPVVSVISSSTVKLMRSIFGTKII